MSSGDLLPVALNLSRVKVLVVGGGPVGARKATQFLECGADVSGIAPQFCAAWPEGASRIERRYQAGDCARYGLVVAATDSKATNSEICSEANARGIWYNNVSRPEGSKFHTSAVLRRGPIAVGINTGGLSPVLAGHLRDVAAAAIGPEYEELIKLVIDCDIELQHRGEFWRRLLASDVLEHLRQGRQSEAIISLGHLSEELLHQE